MSKTLLNILRSASTGLTQPPASESQIAEVEKALGIVFPTDLREFYLTSSGFEGEIGEFYVILSPVEQLPNDNEKWNKQYNPWAIFIGTNGNLEMFVLDKRSLPHIFGLLPNIGDEGDFIPLGYSFESFLGRLMDGTAFEDRPLD